MSYLAHFYYFSYPYRHRLFAGTTDFLPVDSTGNRRKMSTERQETEGTPG